MFSVSIVMALGISRRSLSKRYTGAASGLPCGACVRCFMLVLQFVLVRGVQSGLAMSSGPVTIYSIVFH